MYPINSHSSQFFAPREISLIVSPQAQRGVSLFIALVALVLMTIGGFALMRSVDTGNVIAGNIAFRELTVQASDLAVEAAASYLNATIQPSPDSNLPSGCTVAAVSSSTLGTCRYFAREVQVDDNGIPYVDWTDANIPTTTAGAVTYQYVIDRLCNPDTSVPVETGQDVKLKDNVALCTTNAVNPPDSAQGGKVAYSGTKGGGSRLSLITPLYYRVTVRVTGPRNTVSFVQSLMAR